jgi:hypothetical protein
MNHIRLLALRVTPRLEHTYLSDSVSGTNRMHAQGAEHILSCALARGCALPLGAYMAPEHADTARALHSTLEHLKSQLFS